jgi:alanyl aminopeptidase
VAVGPFDVVSAPIPPNQVRDRVLPQRGFAPKGRGAELGFGLEASTALTAALERWTGIPFPFEKLDHVMLSGFPGAMENAGAVAYDETTFLYQPGVTPRGHRRDIASIVAHEVGHQWFGDLVTLDWWTDTWLNESFATFIDPRMVAGWRADWRPELDGLQETGWIMAEDGLASARSISQPLEQPSDVLGQFDGMSYQKGAAVLTMFEGWIGPERFRDGVRAFLAAHQDGTATRADFLAALSTAAGRDLAPSLSTFLDQPGVPLLTTEVACAAGGAEVRLRQARWQPAGATPAAAARWLLPVCVRGQARGQPFERCTLLEEAEGTLPIPEGCPEWLLPNASAAGYYRFTLPSRDLARLLDRGLPRLTVAEKIALLGNLRAAEQAGVLPYADLLATTVRLAADADEDVVRATLQVLEAADRVLLDDPGREPLRALSRRLYGPRLERLGWAPAPDELERVSRLRVRLVEHLALTAREPQARAELARRGARLLGLDGQPADAAPVDPDLARVALRVVLQDRGAPAFDAAWAALPSTRGALRQALVSAYQAATDPALVARAGTLWRTAGLSPMERFALAQAGSGQPENTPALLARLERELPEVVAATPEGMVGWLPGGLAGLQGPGDGARLRALFEPQVAAHPEVARPLAQALEGIAINLAARARREEVGAAYRAAAR